MRLGKRMKLLEKPFNAVVEYSDRESWWRLHTAKARLNVPKEATSLNDSICKYNLYGRANDLNAIEEMNIPGGIEAKIGSLYFEDIRAIIMIDGRIFLNERIEQKEEYISICLGSVLYKAKSIFNENYFTRMRQRYHMSKFGKQNALQPV